MTGKELICTWSSEAFSCVPSPMVKKPRYLNHLQFLAGIGPSSEPEITAQVAGTKRRKLNEDFTGILGNGSKFTAG